MLSVHEASEKKRMRYILYTSNNKKFSQHKPQIPSLYINIYHPFLTCSLDSLILCLFHATNEQTRHNKNQQKNLQIITFTCNHTVGIEMERCRICVLKLLSLLCFVLPIALIITPIDASHVVKSQVRSLVVIPTVHFGEVLAT